MVGLPGLLGCAPGVSGDRGPIDLFFTGLSQDLAHGIGGVLKIIVRRRRRGLDSGREFAFGRRRGPNR